MNANNRLLTEYRPRYQPSAFRCTAVENLPVLDEAGKDSSGLGPISGPFFCTPAKGLPKSSFFHLCILWKSLLGRGYSSSVDSSPPRNSSTTTS